MYFTPDYNWFKHEIVPPWLRGSLNPLGTVSLTPFDPNIDLTSDLDSDLSDLNDLSKVK